MKTTGNCNTSLCDYILEYLGNRWGYDLGSLEAEYLADKLLDYVWSSNARAAKAASLRALDKGDTTEDLMEQMRIRYSVNTRPTGNVWLDLVAD